MIEHHDDYPCRVMVMVIGNILDMCCEWFMNTLMGIIKGTH